MSYQKQIMIAVLVLFSGRVYAETNMTKMLRRGHVRLEMETQWDNRVFKEKLKNIVKTIDQTRWVVPLRLYLGGSDGIQGVVKLPLVWNQLVMENGTLTDRGIGDLSAGVKVKLLEDTGKTPGFFIESLVKFPTGLSAFETYAGERAGIDKRRGSGSGSFDLSVAAIISAYVDPFETYFKFELDQRGGDEVWIAGSLQRVNYGSRSSAVMGMEMDLGKSVELAIEGRADIYAADIWRADGTNVLHGQGADLKLFRDEALAEGDLRLASSAEWYVGPRFAWKMGDSFRLSLRGDVGITPDSADFRATIGLSTLFGTSLSGRSSSSLIAKGLKSKKQSKAEKSREKSRVKKREGVFGNLQRYIYTRFREAQEAKKKGRYKELAKVVLVLEGLKPLRGELLAGLASMEEKLFLLASEQYRKGESAAKKKQWIAAIRAWREAKKYRPDFEPAVAAMRKHAKEFRAKATYYYRKGIQAYVDRNASMEAIALWKKSMELHWDEKVQASIKKARKKVKALKKLKK